MVSYISLLVPSRVLVNRCIASCVLFLYVGSLHAAILDEVISSSGDATVIADTLIVETPSIVDTALPPLDPTIEYLTSGSTEDILS